MMHADAEEAGGEEEEEGGGQREDEEGEGVFITIWLVHVVWLLLLYVWVFDLIFFFGGRH